MEVRLLIDWMEGYRMEGYRKKQKETERNGYLVEGIPSRPVCACYLAANLQGILNITGKKKHTDKLMWVTRAKVHLSICLNTDSLLALASLVASG